MLHARLWFKHLHSCTHANLASTQGYLLKDLSFFHTKHSTLQTVAFACNHYSMPSFLHELLVLCECSQSSVKRNEKACAPAATPIAPRAPPTPPMTPAAAVVASTPWTSSMSTNSTRKCLLSCPDR